MMDLFAELIGAHSHVYYEMMIELSLLVDQGRLMFH